MPCMCMCDLCICTHVCMNGCICIQKSQLESETEQQKREIDQQKREIDQLQKQPTKPSAKKVGYRTGPLYTHS